MPSIADRLTLDSVLLARSAAWLALTEQAASATYDDLWVPLLFQAGRVRAAQEIWNKSHAASETTSNFVQNGWNVWLREPKTRGVYLFACDRNNLPMAMPMLVYDARVNGTGKLLADLLTTIFPESAAARLNNYAPFLATRTTVGGGHLFNGAWPVDSRVNCARLLAGYEPGPTDFTGYTNALRAFNPAQATPNESLDPSLAGWADFVPLARLGQSEGVGKLTPTLVVTARDLLNYGWEMTGLQMGARYNFVQYRWGVPEQADPIFRSVTDRVDGLMPFFKRQSDARIADYGASLQRLQLVDGFYPRVGWSDPLLVASAPGLDNVRLLVRRQWLRPPDFEAQIRALWDTGGTNDFRSLIQTMHDECGDLGTIAVLGYLNSLDDEIKHISQGAQTQATLAETLPEPSLAYVEAVFTKKFTSLNNFERAQEMEKWYWQNPDSGLEARVFRNYMFSGAYKSAQRFYRQCRKNLSDPVEFSAGMGEVAFVSAYFLGDSEMRQMALDDSASGSGADMLLHVWEAAIVDDPVGLEKTLDEKIERYGDRSGADGRLKKFLPLLPALRDPADSQHDSAIHYFGKDSGWVVLRWIWIQKYRLSAADAIALMGGEETGLFQQIFVNYLKKDVPAMLKKVNAYEAASNVRYENAVLALCLYRQIHGSSPPPNQIDLMPPGAESVREMVKEKVARRGAP